MIKKKYLRSGDIKEYAFLNSDEEGDFDFNNIEADAKVRIGFKSYPYRIWQLSDRVGAVWLNKEMKVSIVVRPKIANLDAVRMYLCLAENQSLFNSYQDVFECYPEEAAIEGRVFTDVTLLQIAVFLRELSRFCQRDLRQGFVRVRQNLVGKVKGKILTGDNLRMNTLRAREDRVVCQFQILSLDTPANRILKSALMRCYRYLNTAANKNYPVLLRWARQCNAALSEVEDVPIHESDFRGIVYSGLMRKYKTPHRYARMILKRLRTDASGNVSENQTVPYILKMNQLFEGYVGVLLAKTGLDFKKQGANIPLTGTNFNIGFRPDYHAMPQNRDYIVVDAKYKAILEDQVNQNKKEELISGIEFPGLKMVMPDAKPSNADVYQVIAYCALLKKHYSKHFNHAVLAVPVQAIGENVEEFQNWEAWLQISPTLQLEGSDIQIYILPCPVPILKQPLNQPDP